MRGGSIISFQFKPRESKKSIKDNIPVNQFRAYHKNPRKKPSGKEFDLFCADIAANGIRTPINARFTWLDEKNDSGDDIYEILSGYCRWEAAKAIGLPVIP